MPTTVDLPYTLLQRIKLRAVHRGHTLKDEIAALLETGLAYAPAIAAAREIPKPVRLRGRLPVTPREIESAIEAGRDYSSRVSRVRRGYRRRGARDARPGR